MEENRLIYNTAKVYPDMIRVYVYVTPYVLPNNPGRKKSDKEKDSLKLDDESLNELSAIRSIRRAKSTFSDIVLCNKFDYFCTFTFDPKKINRYDPNMCKLKMSQWIHNQRRHSPNMSIAIVPELHKDGALHFHALLKNYNGRLKDTGRKTKYGMKISNIPGYRWGFSTAVEIDGNHTAVAAYMKKYMTKDMPTFSGKKRYWVSRNVLRPEKMTNTSILRTTPPLFAKSKYKTDYYEMFEIQRV